jgi:hypothetical protein
MRPLQAIEAPAFAVSDMPQMAHYVHQRACMVVQAMSQYAPVAPPPVQTVAAVPAAEEQLEASQANEIDLEARGEDAGGVIEASAPTAPVDSSTLTPSTEPAVTAIVPDAIPSLDTVASTQASSEPDHVVAPTTAASEPSPAPATSIPDESGSVQPALEAEPPTPAKRKREESDDAIDPDTMTVAQLKASLGALDMDTNGLKKDLVARLKEALANQ